MAEMTPLERKARKLLRDPKGFLVDAFQKRQRRATAKPQPLDPLVPGAAGARFSVESLLATIASRYAILHTIDETELRLGVLEPDVPGIIALFARLARDHRCHLEVCAAGVREEPSSQLSSRLVWALGAASSFRVRIGAARHTLVDLELVPYRRREGSYRTEALVSLRHLPAGSGGLLERGGQLWPSTILGGVPAREPAEEIDVVYTWVSSRDPGWRRLYEQHHGREVDEDRYASRDELRYSMRSLHYYCDWVRTIYVVSNCAPPPWLDVSHGRIVWIAHEQVLRADHLPTFNCHAIETGLLKIPDLAERFVYLNDDFFVLRPLRRRAFFDEAGRSRTFLEPAGTLARGHAEEGEGWIDARLNAQRVLLERYGYAATRIAQHAPYVVKRSEALRMFDELGDAVDRIAATRQRSSEDIPLLSFLYGHYALARGSAVVGDATTQMLQYSNHRTFRLDERATFLCINDGGGSAGDPVFTRSAQRLMEERFPLAAPWERR